MATDRTSHFHRQRIRVTKLLRDWGDVFMGTSDGAFMEIGKDPNKPGPNTPLNSVMLKRMGRNKEALAYEKLEDALVKLRQERPHHYRAIRQFYLTGDVGELEVEYQRRRAKENPLLDEVLRWHDEGIKWLTLFMLEVNIPVKWPDHTRYLESRDRLYAEVEAVYKTFRNENLKKTEAVENVIDFYDGAIGRSTIWKIVQTGEDAGRLPKIVRGGKKKAAIPA